MIAAAAAPTQPPRATRDSPGQANTSKQTHKTVVPAV